MLKHARATARKKPADGVNFRTRSSKRHVAALLRIQSSIVVSTGSPFMWGPMRSCFESFWTTCHGIRRQCMKPKSGQCGGGAEYHVARTGGAKSRHLAVFFARCSRIDRHHRALHKFRRRVHEGARKRNKCWPAHRRVGSSPGGSTESVARGRRAKHGGRRLTPRCSVTALPLRNPLGRRGPRVARCLLDQCAIGT
jgi:hypothetical protein